MDLTIGNYQKGFREGFSRELASDSPYKSVQKINLTLREEALRTVDSRQKLKA